jgi:cytochrome c oxidase subunit 4
MADHGHAHGHEAGVAHAHAHSPEEFRKHVRLYYMVFGALAFLTIVTVGVFYLHLAHGMAIAVAIAVASVKASLVALFFMHLSDEKRIIYWCLLLTVAFFIVLMLVPSFVDLETRHL